jgi:hypothetical protein
VAARITIELKPNLYPPEAVDAFLGNHVYVEAEEGKWQGVVTAADYLEEDRSVRLTVEAIDVPNEPL